MFVSIVQPNQQSFTLHCLCVSLLFTYNGLYGIKNNVLYVCYRRYFAGAVCHCKRRLDCKAVVITGATSGLGKALAFEIARTGNVLKTVVCVRISVLLYSIPPLFRYRYSLSAVLLSTIADDALATSHY
jgi:hypothetical protein